MDVRRAVVFFIVLISTFRYSSELALDGGGSKRRVKRSALGFHMAITCYNPSVNVLGRYGKYGCFCGFSDMGDWPPLDETDNCCYEHDNCYERANAAKSNWMNMWHSFTSNLFASYDCECINGQHHCSTAGSSFATALCKCDRQAGICFARNFHTYREQLHDIDRTVYCKSNITSYSGLDLTMPDQSNTTRILIDATGKLLSSNASSMTPTSGNRETTATATTTAAATTEAKTTTATTTAATTTAVTTGDDKHPSNITTMRICTDDDARTAITTIKVVTITKTSMISTTAKFVILLHICLALFVLTFFIRRGTCWSRRKRGVERRASKPVANFDL